MIRGWRALEEFTGLKEHRLRRAIGHYGFPEPYLRKSKQDNGRISRINCWNKRSVANWMSNEISAPFRPHPLSQSLSL